MGFATMALSHFAGPGMVSAARIVIGWVQVACLCCGLLFAALCFENAFSHWAEHAGEATADGLPTDFRNILQSMTMGLLALINTLAFAWMFVRRGVTLVAPVAYVGSSFVLTFWALMTTMTFAKSGAIHQDVLGRGGWWAPGGWVSLSSVATNAVVVISIWTACVLLNVGLSSWRGLEGGRLHRWSARFRKTVATI
jgi:hypothetical protein